MEFTFHPSIPYPFNYLNPISLKTLPGPYIYDLKLLRLFHLFLVEEDGCGDAKKINLLNQRLMIPWTLYYQVYIPDDTRSGIEVIKPFSCSTQLSRKFQLLIETKIPTNEDVSCLKSLRCCIYHAIKC